MHSLNMNVVHTVLTADTPGKERNGEFETLEREQRLLERDTRRDIRLQIEEQQRFVEEINEQADQRVAVEVERRIFELEQRAEESLKQQMAVYVQSALQQYSRQPEDSDSSSSSVARGTPKGKPDKLEQMSPKAFNAAPVQSGMGPRNSGFSFIPAKPKSFAGQKCT